MAMKVVVNYPGAHSAEKLAAVCQRVADALGICCEDVLCFTDMTVVVVDVPDAMVKKADKETKAEAHAAYKKTDHK